MRLRPSALSAADRDGARRHRRRRALRRRRSRPAAAGGRQVHAGPVAPQGPRRAGCARRGAAARRRRRDRRDPAATARSTASPSSRSAAAPAWSAASTRIRGDFKAVVSLDLRTAERTAQPRRGLRRGRTRRRASPDPRPSGCSAHVASRSATSRRAFSSPRIGGFAATRSSGQDSAGYGRFDDMVRGLRAVTPAGVLDLGRAPASAAGPDLRQLMLGSEGVFGVITRVRVRVHPVPAATRYEAWSFPDFATGAAALRAVIQTGTGPTVIRLSDEAETGVNLATTEQHRREQPSPAAAWRSRCSRAPTAHAESRHAETAGGAGGHGRHVARRGARAGLGTRPLRCAVPARLAAVGGRAVRDAGDRDQLVQPSGAEGRRDRGADDRARRNRHTGTGAVPHFACVSHRARRCTSPSSPGSAATRSSSGARRRPPRRTRWCAPARTITHHHAVGADHRPWMRDEVGDLGVEVLRAVKATLDPAGILNPGKLIP